MKSDQISEWISRYHEGTLEGKELEEFLGILAGDDQVRKELEVEREIARALGEKEMLEFRKVIRRARNSSLNGWLGMFLLAASLAAVLTIGGFILYRTLYLNPPAAGNQVAKHDSAAGTEPGPRETTEEKQEPPSQHPPAHADRQLLAEQYTPLRSMENLVGEITRADDILVTAPEPSASAKPGDRIRFTWRSNSPGPVTIHIFDNRGNRIMEITPTDESSYLLDTRSFTPGLYYWKFLKHEKFVTAGKIRLE